MSAKLPKKIGSYLVEKHLQDGATGGTYKVRSASGQILALKLYHSTSKGKDAKRFVNEMHALKSVKHDLIPAFRDEGQFESKSFLVMDFIDGRTLEDIIKENSDNNGPASERFAIAWMMDILEVLHYLHSNDTCHRDIKPGNLILRATDRRVVVVDLGLCKSSDTPLQETFDRVGAISYSPPSKIENPKIANPKHDTFAVGVLAYELLTNQKPWFDPKKDYNGVRQLMLQTIPPPVRRLNGFVGRPLSDLIERLMNINDHERPSALEALDALKGISVDYVKGRVPTGSFSAILHKTRVIRDPVHKDVRLTDFELSILACVEVQRLRRVKQLGFANLIYPGAEHSRLSHMIGVAHVAEKCLRAIEERIGEPFNVDDLLLARCYGLCHDIAHVAYGHTLEDEIGLFGRHDRNLARFDRIFNSQGSEIGKRLRGSDIGLQVLEKLRPTEDRKHPNWLDDVIDGPVGADVIDYIDRDALFCGLDHRVDSAIFRRLSLDMRSEPARARLLAQLYRSDNQIRPDAEYALLSILRERYALFLKVYAHRAKAIAGAMLGKAVFIARKKDANLEEVIEKMGDGEFLHFLAASEDETVKSLVDMLLRRQFYLPAFVYAPLLKTDASEARAQYDETRKDLKRAGFFSPESRNAIEERIATRAGLQPSKVIIYCPRTAPGLKKIEAAVSWSALDSSPHALSERTHPPITRIHVDHFKLWSIGCFVHPLTSARERQIAADTFKRAVGFNA